MVRYLGGSGSWVIDHTMDNVPIETMRHGSIVTLTDPIDPGYDENAVLSLETKSERRRRKISHWVAYSTMFVMSIGFSIVLTGVWPYLKELDNTSTKEFLGWVVAANPLGQMLASPFLGYWGNKAGSIRIPCLVTVICFVFGNVLYCLLKIFPTGSAKFLMIFARFVVGVSSANLTLCRSYLASSTTLRERTVGIAIISASQALGFVVGPAIQTILTVTIPEPIDTGVDWLILDMYTAAGWVAAVFGLVNFVIILPCIFQEYPIAQKEMSLRKNENNENSFKIPQPDYIAIVGLIYIFFVNNFAIVLLEMLSVPFVEDQYAWKDEFAVEVSGIVLGIAGVLALGVFVGSGYLAKRFDERKVLIFHGIIPFIIGTFLFLPWGDERITMSVCGGNITDNSTTTFETSIATTPFALPVDEWPPQSLASLDHLSHGIQSHWKESHELLGMAPPLNILTNFDEGEDPPNMLPDTYSGDMVSNDEASCTPGCPPTQEWCLYVPPLPVPQFLVALVITFSGYPAVVTLSQAMYSKMLGPKPQGLWMGLLTGIGSLSRIAGPLFVSYVYTGFGTYFCFGTLTSSMAIGFIMVLLLYRRLIPMKIENEGTEMKQGHTPKSS
ncbi:major facilitator superfamily domain-containing protein 8-like isoform X1 [Oratosquilla oratoria]|uniref:major facilitator superfamily domain-containing protein 8-like isoform X1 n=1 Tax=Oratosquilla oratoria TaxID=337810 RepID=UPI003F76BC7E